MPIWFNTIPWLISLWVAVPGKYVLWGAAVLFELGKHAGGDRVDELVRHREHETLKL